MNFDYVAGGGEDPVADALDYFTRIGPAARTLAQADLSRRDTLLASLRETLTAHVRNGQVTFPAAAWIWTAQNGEEAA